jgi:hypothetical protein
MTYTRAAEDIADLYRNYIDLKNDVETHNLSVPLNMDGMASKIGELETQFASVASGTTVMTMYDEDDTVYPDSIRSIQRCGHHVAYGEAVLPHVSVESEFHYIDPISGQRTLIDNVEQFVHSCLTSNRYQPKMNEIYENSNVNAIDLTSDRMHMIKAITRNSDIQDITLVYNIDTEGPKSINTIRVFPVPELVASYEDITITKANGTEETLSDVTDTAVSFPITKARKRSFRFSPVEITQVSVLLNTTSYSIIDNSGSKQFVLGSRLIALENVTHMNEGYIGLHVEVPEGKTIIGKITPVYEGYAENIDVSVYDDLTEFNAVSESYVIQGSASTVQSVINTATDADDLYLLFKLTTQENNTTPILKGCVITWL